MSYLHPFATTAFHSCDRNVALRVLNGQDELKPSTNPWDWLAHGIYFWEQNPLRALEYAQESSQNKQFNKVRIEVPFVLGANINLGNCLNLVESQSLQILKSAYESLRDLKENILGEEMPKNNESNRALDCAVIQYIHEVNRIRGNAPYDNIRCAFSEGDEAYPGSAFTTRLHIQICVLNPDCIQGYFLPRPLKKYNPNL